MPFPFHPRRRDVLAAGLATLALPLMTRPADAASGQDDHFAALDARAAELMTGGDIDPEDPVFAGALDRLTDSATELWNTLDRSTGRTYLWPDLQPIGDSANFGQSYTRLRTLATAWATPGTTWYGDDLLAAEIVSALAMTYERGYNEHQEQLGNWWFWEIGAPRALMDTCVLLGDRLPQDRLADYLRVVERWVPDPNDRTRWPIPETGANRADKCMIVALHGILGHDPDRVADARDAMSDLRGNGRHSLFQLVTSGDGLYPDGSMIQHNNVAYTGSYGVVMLEQIARVTALLQGSPWELDDPRRTVVFDSVEQAFAPFIVDGLMMDSVRGRAISRERGRDHHSGASAITSILLLAGGAPDEYRSRYHGLVKGWLERNTVRPYLDLVDVPALSRALAVLDDPAVTPAAPMSGHRVFADMDRVVHRRPGWSFALSLSSRRIAAYEGGNDENYRGWYTGDGMTYLYNDDLGQFNEDFWPTVDAHRLPGTTVEIRHRDPIGTGSGTSTYAPENTRWVGGAVLGGSIGAAGMELEAQDSTLRAKKSWFCLDDAVVALGSAIACTSGNPVETVVENRNLHADPDATFTVDGRPLSPSGRTGMSNPSWAHLAGVGGYVFPDGGTVRSYREERTGTWREINAGADTGGSDRLIGRTYQTVLFEHGSDPDDASYAYVLLPGMSAHDTGRWAAQRPVRILGNNSSVQAIEHRALFAACFWEAAEAGGVVVDGPAAVLVHRHGDRIEVAASDPSRTAAVITVELPHPARGIRHADSTVQVETGRRPVLTIQTGGSRGYTHNAGLTTHG